MVLCRIIHKLGLAVKNLIYLVIRVGDCTDHCSLAGPDGLNLDDGADLAVFLELCHLSLGTNVPE